MAHLALAFGASDADAFRLSEALEFPKWVRFELEQGAVAIATSAGRKDPSLFAYSQVILFL